MEMEQQPARSSNVAAVTGGVIVLGVGVAMLLDSTGAIDVRLGRLIGPLVMITLGATMLLNTGGTGSCDRAADEARPRRRGRHGGRGRLGGIWLIGLGAWMLVSQTHLFGLDFGNSWPLIVILAGVMIMIRGVR